jgi:hypothetical protein
MYEGCRVTCKDCSAFRTSGHCIALPNEIKVSGSNNVCDKFRNRIINPSMSEFNYNDYFEWLMNDYYRPYGITEEIIGSAKMGEVLIDKGLLAELLPNVYRPFYKTYDKPYCRVNIPKCHIKINGNEFDIDYKKYKNHSFLENNIVTFISRRWKDKPSQKRYHSEHYGEYEIKTGE